MKTVQDLIAILTLDDVGDNAFRGVSENIGTPNVFGGQVLSQALNAAYRTVPEERILHSLHSYFLEAGNLTIPIIYKVEETRNGGSFSARRVKAMQNDVTIFILAASFHKQEKGYEHQKAIKKDIKQPEELYNWEQIVQKLGDHLPNTTKTFLSVKRPVEFKPVVMKNPAKRKNLPATEDIWFRVRGNVNGLNLSLKQQILTYISDYNVLNAAMNPNAEKANFGNTQTASLDHSMWFFRDFDFDDWLLFSAESPSTYGARGLVTGNIFTRSGKLIASFAQEGLMRPKRK